MLPVMSLVDTNVHCTQCGYNLTGLSDARCPECGSPFGSGKQPLYSPRTKALCLAVLRFLLFCVVIVVTAVVIHGGARGIGGDSESLVLVAMACEAIAIGGWNSRATAKDVSHISQSVNGDEKCLIFPAVLAVALFAHLITFVVLRFALIGFGILSIGGIPLTIS